MPNKGQFESHVLYKALIPGGILFVEKNCLTYCLVEGEAFKKYHDTRLPGTVVKGHAFKVWFDGCNESITSKEEQPTSEYYNYFLGSDPSKWASRVYGAHKITLINIYNKIDIEIFSTQGQFLKYNFIVHPGGNISNIKLRYEGIENLHLEHGNISIPTSLGPMLEEAPISLQDQKTVSSKFNITGSTITYEVNKYDQSKTLIIDPKVVFSTFSGSFADNWGFTGTYDNSGNGYSGGTVYNIGYPVTIGAFQKVFNDGVFVNTSVGEYARDAGILKYRKKRKIAKVSCLFWAPRGVSISLWQSMDSTLPKMASRISLS
ncbi:MAG: hypothetical protein NTW54_12770 [Bacteroidetes bacterium]|nr:hypothetical protein [Bacteroidota bacterium]